MKCRDCPVRGRQEGKYPTTNLCFCAGRGSTKIKIDDDCKYGIEDYMEYWKQLVERSEKTIMLTPSRTFTSR